MLALARLQRKFRLLESPYRTPQTLVGGPRADAALMSLSGRTATTKAMGVGSTQFQHLIQTEVPPKVLKEWLDSWCKRHDMRPELSVQLRPHSAGSTILELSILTAAGGKAANVVFEPIQDRFGRGILSIRDQNNFEDRLRRKRLMTLMQLFLIHRYNVDSVHYLTPSDDNHRQTEGMRARGIFGAVNDEVGQIIVAEVDKERVRALVTPDSAALAALIAG
jgi:isocitrate lyase